MARNISPSSVPAASSESVPGSILIVGAGVFGLSTFYHLLTLSRYNQSHITLLDTHLPSLESSAHLPVQNPNAASIDSSRIVRPDYANPSYARLAIAAQEKWRKGYGDCLSCGQNGSVYSGIKGTGEVLKCEDKTCEHEPVYREPGAIISGSGNGTEYLRKAKKNAEELGLNVRTLDSYNEIIAVLDNQTGVSRTDREACHEGEGGDAHSDKNSRRDVEARSHAANRPRRERNNDRASAVGETGYINYSSGWVNNGRAMANIMTHSITLAQHRNRQQGKGNVSFVCGKAVHLLFSANANEPSKVTGVTLANGDDVQADLTILATGAHTPSLLDLRGRAEARGQVMAYISLTPAEARGLRDTPVLLNMSTGMFAIPPVLVSLPSPPHPNNSSSSRRSSHPSTKTWLFKVAQHAYGYANPTRLTITTPGNISKEITASIPAAQYTPIPLEAEHSLRTFLQSLLPPGAAIAAASTRPFLTTRLCWYTDTPTGDFLIDNHPSFPNLFLATGGSGHAFKFLPVLGEKIVAKIEGRLELDLDDLWKWRGRREGEGMGMMEFQGTEDGSRGGRKGEVLSAMAYQMKAEGEGEGEGEEKA